MRTVRIVSYAAYMGLIESIEVWLRAHMQMLRGGAPFRHGLHKCPLCKLYRKEIKDTETISCLGCPIATKTGEVGCQGTPYADYNEQAKLIFVSNDEVLKFHWTMIRWMVDLLKEVRVMEEGVSLLSKAPEGSVKVPDSCGQACVGAKLTPPCLTYGAHVRGDVGCRAYLASKPVPKDDPYRIRVLGDYASPMAMMADAGNCKLCGKFSHNTTLVRDNVWATICPDCLKALASDDEPDDGFTEYVCKKGSKNRCQQKSCHIRLKTDGGNTNPHMGCLYMDSDEPDDCTWIPLKQHYDEQLAKEMVLKVEADKKPEPTYSIGQRLIVPAPVQGPGDIIEQTVLLVEAGHRSAAAVYPLNGALYKKGPASVLALYSMTASEVTDVVGTAAWRLEGTSAKA